MDAVCRLVNEGSGCCSFSNLIVGKYSIQKDTDDQSEADSDPDGDVSGIADSDGLNPNQVRAVESSDSPLALIWGPPGIVTIRILMDLKNLTTVQALEKPQWS